MKSKTAVLILTLLSVVTAACSSTEDKLVGEWQSSKPESVHLKIAKTGSSNSDYHDGFSYTRGGQTYTNLWRISNGSLFLADTGYWGDFSRRTGNASLTESTHKIIDLTSDRLVVEWGYRGSILDGVKEIYEFQRVK